VNRRTVRTNVQTLAAQALITRLVLAMEEVSRQAGARFVVVYFDEPWLRQPLEGSGVLQVDWGPATPAVIPVRCSTRPAQLQHRTG
jgi:hypothetical protein